MTSRPRGRWKLSIEAIDSVRPAHPARIAVDGPDAGPSES